MTDDLHPTVPADDSANGTTTATANQNEALAAARAKADENYNKFLYAMADFENYKKRVERQLADISLAGKKSVLKKILPVLDNLERALAFKNDADGLRGGLEATLRGFESMLESEGVKAVSLKGERFDPKRAEAIGTQEAPAGVPDDTVLEEAQKAYVMGDDVLRVGQVIVAKGSPG
jgi:molecular chaperone GrpE